MILHAIGANTHCHYDFFERRIARPLADTVDCAFYLPCACFNAGKGVCHCKPEIVVAMNGHDGFVDIADFLAEVGYQGAILGWKRVADRIGNIQRGGASFNCCLKYFAEEIEVRTRRVFGRKFFQ